MTNMGAVIGIGSLGTALLALILSQIRVNETKRNRIYERLDEVKLQNDERFVMTQVCEERSEKIIYVIEQLKNDIQESKSVTRDIQQDIKQLLHKNGVK